MTTEPRLLGGRYRLGPVLGRGGMAEVRRAHDTRLGRDVAIKQLRSDLAGDATFQARFRREAQAAAGLNHPTIVSVYDTGVRADPDSDVEIPYIVMELVDGETLKDILKDGRRILPERAFELTQGVLEALTYSHKAGIIHRDIKPANVMLTRTGAVKVMDFGIARAVSDTSATMTQTAAVIGTAQYLSPEQARGEKVDARSDVYAAGCLLYELLAGRPPFVGDSPVSVAYQHVRETPVAPSEVDGGDDMITADMDAVCLKALAKDPADRFQSAKEMRDDITRLLSGSAVTAVIPAAFAGAAEAPSTQVIQAAPPVQDTGFLPETAPAPEPRRSTNPIVPVLWTIGVIALLGAIAWGVWLWLDSQREPEPELVTVPSIVGQTPVVAEGALTDRNLKMVSEDVKGPDDTTVGTIIKQDPDRGEKVVPGTTVTVQVNVGPDKVTVPTDLVGMQVSEAKAALRELGFTDENIKTQDAEDEGIEAEPLEVTAIDPPGGTTVAKDAVITLSVATGKSEVPNVNGFSEDEAIRALENNGFKNHSVTYRDDISRDGEVIDQTPSPGTSIFRTEEVEIVVARLAPVETESASPPPVETTKPPPDPTKDPAPSDAPTSPSTAPSTEPDPTPSG